MEDQIKATIASANNHVLQAYNKLEELGATMPEHKNIENLRATVYTLPLNVPKVSVTFDTGEGDPVVEEVFPGQTVTKPADPTKDGCIFLGWHKQTTPPYDPANPTIDGLKAALDAGDYAAFPANTTIPDTYNGEEFNWVVGHYSTATMSDGTTREGVYLFADKIVTESSFGGSAYYGQSAIYTWLNGTFLPACSDTMKSLVGEISVTGSDATHSVNAKFWLMSIGEVMGEAPSTSNGEGVAWDAWKIRTGLSSPSTANNSGRIMQYNGTDKAWWTRSLYTTATAWAITIPGGAYNYSSASYTMGVVPACFIPKSSASTQSNAITAQEYNDKNITSQAYNAKSITAHDYNTNAKGVL